VVAALAGVIPCGPVNSIADIAADPHIAARGMLQELEQPGLDRTVRVPSSPIKMTETPAGPRGRAPLLGEDTDAVLAAAGYSGDDIAALRERGAVR
jgi:crotonobetainyl-CoA:carnitine CoA-transferase CaiB-like acyl-CoA transferase